MQYIHAIKHLNKKYYFTPFLILAYISIIMQLWDGTSRFIAYSDKEVMDFVIFVVSIFKAYALYIIQILCYPHANYFIQSSWLYRKIFGTTWGVVASGVSTYANIGKNIPDDYYIRGSRGSTFTITSGYKRKMDRVSDARGLYLVYLLFKLFFKDIVLRLFTHLGIFAISPILFLIAVPILRKKDMLRQIEK